MSNKMALDARGDIRKDMPSSAYKMGDEFKPFHPGASHVRPEWRDGWNACFIAAIAALQAEEVERLAAQAAPSSAHSASLCGDVEPFVFEEYPYNSEAMGCGLEDRDITDRYEAMAYGWSAAMERAAEAIPDDLYSASTVAALKARAAELEKDAARYRWLRQEHERFDPLCHLSWKAGGDRNSSEWVNTAALDSAIDAAITKGQQ